MDERGYRSRSLGRLKTLIALVVIAFAVTLAVVVGSRLSDEALSVLAGAACGVGAAIPTSLLIVAVSRRRAEPQPQPPVPQGSYPPVVVVTALGGHQQTGGWNALPPSLTAPMSRQFTVVGGPSTDEDRFANERYS